MLELLADLDEMIDVIVELNARWKLGLEKGAKSLLRIFRILFELMDLLADIPAAASDG